MSEWPSLEKELDCNLLYPNSRCAFGFGSSFEVWLKAIFKNRANLDIELLETSSARKLYPQFRFPTGAHVLRDNNSAVIAAKEMMDTLPKALKKQKVSILENRKVLTINPTASKIQLETTKGPLTCERLVITAGPWMGQFASQLKINCALCPVKQIVGYFKMQGAKEHYRVGQFPNWVYIGEGENSDFYGLPEFGGIGIKVAQEVMEGEISDPDDRHSEIDPRKIKALQDFVSEQFVSPIERLIKLETCFYTNTKTSDFILDLLPSDNRIAIGSACSGHGFKFAPLTGKILAELILHGKTTISEFEKNRDLFSLSTAAKR